MGGGDIETAACVAKRADKMMKSILNMPVGYEWVFRRGEKPLYTKALDLDEYVKSREYKVERAEGR
jgi:type IV secretion system protein VirD4